MSLRVKLALFTRPSNIQVCTFETWSAKISKVIIMPELQSELRTDLLYRNTPMIFSVHGARSILSQRMLHCVHCILSLNVCYTVCTVSSFLTYVTLCALYLLSWRMLHCVHCIFSLNVCYSVCTVSSLLTYVTLCALYLLCQINNSIQLPPWHCF